MIKIKLKMAGNILFMSFLTVVFGVGCTTYQEAYKVTPSGVIEEKEIPESRVIQTELAQDYFTCSKILSSRLYEYIDKRKIPKALPVEADYNNTSKAKMRFYLCGVDKDRVLKDTTLVKVINSEKKTVISAGGSGSYTYKNLNNTRTQLLAWLRDNKGYVRKGETYAVFWDSPYTLWFLKRFEVQVVVEKAKPQDEKK